MKKSLRSIKKFSFLIFRNLEFNYCFFFVSDIAIYYELAAQFHVHISVEFRPGEIDRMIYVLISKNEVTFTYIPTVQIVHDETLKAYS